MSASLDWSKLPRELKWLATPAERYWRLREDGSVDDFLRRATLKDRADLQEWARGWGFCGDLIDEWLEAHPVAEHPEAERVLFLADLFGRAEQAGLM